MRCFVPQHDSYLFLNRTDNYIASNNSTPGNLFIFRYENKPAPCFFCLFIN